MVLRKKMRVQVLDPEMPNALEEASPGIIKVTLRRSHLPRSSKHSLKQKHEWTANLNGTL
jgi:hypothetical protein